VATRDRWVSPSCQCQNGEKHMASWASEGIDRFDCAGRPARLSPGMSSGFPFWVTLRRTLPKSPPVDVGRDDVNLRGPALQMSITHVHGRPGWA